MDFEFNIPKSQHNTNPTYLKALEIAQLTKTTPARWLRTVKNHPWAVERSLNELRDLSAKNKAAYFQWLLKKFIGEEKHG